MIKIFVKATCLLLFVLEISSLSLNAAGPAQATLIPVGDNETVVFYGDSISHMNVYTAIVETFLYTRFPKKNFTCWNFGVSGDTASGGCSRFVRDVSGTKPTLVFVNFGMNDGKYVAFDQAIFDSYVKNQSELAKKIKDLNAREILLTTSPTDPDTHKSKGVYNGTLERFADRMLKLAEELQIPSIDIFHPMLAVQKKLKEKDPSYTWAGDGVHPKASGHLVMAAMIIDRIEAPRGIGRLDINGTDVKASGVTVANVKGPDGLAEFDVTLPFLPFYIPEKTREVLDLLPNLRQLNELTLKVSGLDPKQKYALVSEGKPSSAAFTGAELAEGVDVSLAAGTPWAEQTRKVWDLAKERNKICSEIWHPLWAGEKPAKFSPFIDRMSDESRAKLKDISEKLSAAARVTTFHVALAKSAAGADKRMKSEAK
ncbi:MAG: hypothetical protein A2X45_01375 [Lentisphaerae bacterium GWF2_50_93]|nr:MAG: hypothetical protein A2X45_01375 [Lentisphaerae bacterium GWF2_50_93]